jgi:hypothetical protein
LPPGQGRVGKPLAASLDDHFPTQSHPHHAGGIVPERFGKRLTAGRVLERWR